MVKKMSSSKRSQFARSKAFTLHLDPEVIEKLTLEAEAQELSVNVIANRALRKYVDWDIVGERFRIISTSTSLLAKMMTWVPEEYARELGRSQWLQEWRTMATSSYPGKGAEAGLRIFELFGRYGRRFHVDRATSGPSGVLALLHGMGRKWSLFYEGMMEAMLGDTFKDEITWFKLTSTDNQVFAEFSTQSLKHAESSGRSRPAHAEMRLNSGDSSNFSFPVPIRLPKRPI